MRLHRLATAWKQFQRRAKQEWGQLPEGSFHELESRRERLACLLQERHGVACDEADRQIDQWVTGPAKTGN
jgi:uncharacterized protein YjbJ (UPF0337 family)